MNTNYTKVLTRFAPQTRFEVKPVAPAPFRATQETGLDKLKHRLLQEFLYERTGSEFNAYVRRAANEAAALAWVTPYPLLMFPELFEEKALAALVQGERQVNVRKRSLELLAL